MGGKTDFSTDTRYKQNRNLTLVCTHSTGCFCNSDIHTVFSPASSAAEQMLTDTLYPKADSAHLQPVSLCPLEMPLTSLSL